MNKPFDGLFCIMILPANNGNLSPNVTQSLSKVIVGIKESLSPLVDQIYVSKSILSISM